MLKRCIGCTCRWICQIFQNMCQIDLNNDAQGLANCLVPEPLTTQQKTERHQEQLLAGVDDFDKEKILEHFCRLSTEVDPLENIENIPPDSVKTV